MKQVIFLLSLLLTNTAFSQQWIDTLYSVNRITDVSYGTAFDFAGNPRDLKMDVTLPLNDQPPTCGRPLLVFVHGGGFIGGDKSESGPVQWSTDFAKRGYVSASVNYRLGMFQTSSLINCNVTQLFNTPWNCLNNADTLEWLRAYYRGIQDVKGAIRFLISNRQQYNIDPNNVFVVGESAGGFIAMGVSYLDTITERPSATYALADVPAPNAIYESTCIQNFNLDTNIASMNLQRPDLGGINGDLNPGNSYTIRGVGNLYGALFFDLFSQNTYATPPPLYLFHQPNDLIVPFGFDKLFASYSYCFAQAPFNCSYLSNTPYVYGSFAIKRMLDSLQTLGLTVPAYVFEQSTNTADCLAQYLNPALGGHSVDNYGLRSSSMANLFASKIDTTCITAISEIPSSEYLIVYPQPASGSFHFICEKSFDAISLIDLQGRKEKINCQRVSEKEFVVETENAPKGIYFLVVTDGEKIRRAKVIYQ